MRRILTFIAMISFWLLMISGAVLLIMSHPQADRIGTRLNPVPLNVTQRVTFTSNQHGGGVQTWDVIITRVIRGANAEQLVVQENPFNLSPTTDKTFVVALVKATLISSTGTAAALLDSAYFEGYSDARVLTNVIVSPSPTLSLTAFPGASGSGWVTAQVFRDDPHPALLWQTMYGDPGGDVYFAAG